MPTIAQRDLRNKSGEVLRRAEHGTNFVVTVGGRPVAQLGPIPRRSWVSRETLGLLARGIPSEPTLARDLRRHGDRLRGGPDPWVRRRRSR